MPTLEVQFASGPRTRCVIDTGASSRIAALAREAGLTGPGLVICDARLPALHGALLASLGEQFGEPIARPVDEARKALPEVETICEALAARRLPRDGYVVALGGGVLTDLAGFAAAIYLRGVPWVSVPTTLLAQVDAGLGGKTGANLRAGKNLVGAFHQPKLMVCDPALLATLPERELWSGLAEVVKCALLEGGQLLERCEADLERAARGDAQALLPLIEGSVRLKARIVAADEREGGDRAFLNLGHTAGHALEAATSYSRFTHGEAVALGLRATLALSDAMPDKARAERLVGRLRVSVPASLDLGEREAALAAMTRDKKARRGKVRFVVLDRIGAPRIREASAEDCQRALSAAAGEAR